MAVVARDYRYLLENLLPYRRLSLERRRAIARALAQGSGEEMRREALAALDELAASSYLEKLPPRRERDRLVLSYRRRGSALRIVLTLPPTELEEPRASEVDKVSHPPPRPAVQVLPEVAGSLAINEKQVSLPERLERLAKRFPRWLGVASAEIIIVEEKLEGVESSASVRTESADSFEKNLYMNKCRHAGRAVLAPPFPDSRSGRAKAFAPLLCSDGFWGVVGIEGEEEELEEKADVAAAVVTRLIDNNVRLEKLISVDKLTKLFNRRFYDRQLPIEIERATRTGANLAMLVIDIDDFKEINDRLGHSKGDEALILVSELIRKNLRKIDLAFRYGGEEFVILLPGTGLMEAIHTAERLRSVVESSSALKDDRGRPCPLTVSIGIAVYPTHARSAEKLFMQADEAMYSAKRAGKNRIEFHR